MCLVTFFDVLEPVVQTERVLRPAMAIHLTTIYITLLSNEWFQYLQVYSKIIVIFFNKWGKLLNWESEQIKLMSFFEPFR